MTLLRSLVVVMVLMVVLQTAIAAWRFSNPTPEKEPLTFQEKLQQLRMEQLLRERQLEQEQMLQEEIEDLMSSYELEELATMIGTDTLAQILRGTREQPTVMPLPDCVTRDIPIDLEFITGTISYKACGKGPAASIQARFRLPGETTTPIATTPAQTTAAETTPPGTTTPAFRCPTLPTTEAPAAETTTPGTTTPASRCPTLPTTPAPTTTESAETTTAGNDVTTVSPDGTTTPDGAAGTV